MKLTFILSQGRTGTVFLDNVLSRLPGITSKHERQGHLLRAFYHMRYNGINNRFVNSLALRLIAKPLIKKENSGKPHIEINNQIKYYINSVVDKFPDATYIHIVRDPRTHVVSGLNWTLDKPLNKFLKLYFPYWSPRPHHYTLGKDTLSKLFEITNINWREANKSYLSIEKSIKNYHLFKFEDFVQDQVGFLQKILEIAGYKYWQDREQIEKAIKDSPRNASTKKVFPHWHSWDDRYILYIQDNCSSLMARLGYGQEPEWKEKVFLANKNTRKNAQ